MKVVVTGAAGFIGSHTCERLVGAGHQVVGIDSFDRYLYPAEPKRNNAADLRAKLSPDKFTLLELDICDTEAVSQVLTPSVDVLCHLAALAGVRPSLMEPQRYIRTNLEGTTTLYEACRKSEINRIVFASSSSVYGVRNADSNAQAFQESDLCLTPASPYAATKRSGELLSSTYRDLYGLGISCLRFFTVFGPRQRPDMAMHKFVKAICRGEAIPVFGDGSSRRDYTYIDDIVSGVVAAIERVQPASYSIYNLGGTATTSLSEMIETIEEVIGQKAKINRLPDQPGDVPITSADISLATRELSYKPKTSVRVGLEHFWRWYQEQAQYSADLAGDQE